MKVQKSIRLDAAAARRVDGLQRDGESFSAACERLILAGVEALEGCGGEAGAGGGSDGGQAAQLAAKDAQIAELLQLLAQGQQLQMAQLAATSRPTLAQRFRALLGKGGGEDGR